MDETQRAAAKKRGEKYYLAGTNITGKTRAEVAAKAAAAGVRGATSAGMQAGRGVVGYWLQASQAAYGGKNPKLKWEGGMQYGAPVAPPATAPGHIVGSMEEFLGFGVPKKRKQKR